MLANERVLRWRTAPCCGTRCCPGSRRAGVRYYSQRGRARASWTCWAKTDSPSIARRLMLHASAWRRARAPLSEYEQFEHCVMASDPMNWALFAKERLTTLLRAWSMTSVALWSISQELKVSASTAGRGLRRATQRDGTDRASSLPISARSCCLTTRGRATWTRASGGSIRLFRRGSVPAQSRSQLHAPNRKARVYAVKR